MEVIMAEIQTIKVGHQGISGSFSEEALFNYFPNDVEIEQYTQFEDVFEAIDAGEIHYGVVPIENSSTGAIAAVYDALNAYNCTIVGETYVKAIQNLLAIKGASIDYINTVYSHPQGFEQSVIFLKPYDWILIPYYNTAKSAEFVRDQNDPKIAAIASKQADEIYGLDVLSENIYCNKTQHVSSSSVKT
jgi:chorismate mutase/prephenate dehydratase